MAVNELPRTPRAAWKIALRWLTGFLTDPHTRATSAARVVGLVTTFALAAYVVICALRTFRPDAAVCGELSALVCAALALRAKSTQVGALPPDRRRSDDPPAPPPPPETP